MKTIISIAVIIASLLLISQLTIQFKPFSISLPYWHRGVGLLLVILGFLVYNIGEHSKGYAEGLTQGYELTIKTIKEMYKDKQNETD